MKSEKLLSDFVRYCNEHPEERFWQALRNWVGWGYIFVSKNSNEMMNGDINRDLVDTFYWETNK